MNRQPAAEVDYMSMCGHTMLPDASRERRGSGWGHMLNHYFSHTALKQKLLISHLSLKMMTS